MCTVKMSNNTIFEEQKNDIQTIGEKYLKSSLSTVACDMLANVLLQNASDETADSNTEHTPNSISNCTNEVWHLKWGVAAM